MPRSPPQTRLRSRFGATTDKRPQRRSLSTPDNTDPLPTTMASSIAKSDLEQMISDCLSDERFIGKLIVNLAAKVREGVVEALTDSLREAKEEINQLKSQVSSLKSDLVQLELRATNRSDDLEQYTRRNNLRVFGIPEVAGEDTDAAVAKVFKEKMNIDIPIEKIERSHRVGKKIGPAEDGRPRWRPIIVRFISYRDRRRVFQAKKQLKGTEVSVREDLTAQRAEVLRAAVAKYGVRNTWTLDGRVLWVHNGVKGMANYIADLQ